MHGEGISRYWYLAFEEWLVTKRFGNEALAVLMMSGTWASCPS